MDQSQFQRSFAGTGDPSVFSPTAWVCALGFQNFLHRGGGATEGRELDLVLSGQTVKIT